MDLSDDKSKGTAIRFEGYSQPVFNKQLADREKDQSLRVYADDPRLLLTGDQMLAMGRWVEMGMCDFETTGRHGLSPLAKLPYFDPCWHYAIPLVHAGIYGVLKVITTQSCHPNRP
jgi:hypothetical protein